MWGPLAEALRERMGDETQTQFAQRLGVHQSRLNVILHGLIPKIESKAAQAILRTYPELAPFFLPEHIVQAIRNSGNGTEMP